MAGRTKKSGSTTPAARPAGKRRIDPRWGHAACGAILAMLLWLGALDVGIAVIPVLRWRYMFLLMGVLGAGLALTRARALLWISGGLVCAMIVLIGFTPWIPLNVAGMVRRDEPERTEAVVVLSSDVQEDGELTPAAQWRLLEAYGLLTQGYARRMVVTRLRPPKQSYLPAVRRQMRLLGLDYPVEETEPVRNTRDEAVEVSRIAKQRGWRRVLLVTDAPHTRRAKAAFQKAGLEILSVPCSDRQYDSSALSDPGDRLKAFIDWLYETLGYQYYRMRGWV